MLDKLKEPIAYLATAVAASPFSGDACSSGSYSSATLSSGDDASFVQEDAHSGRRTMKTVQIRMSRPDIFGDRIEIPESKAYVPIRNAPDLIIEGEQVIIDRWGMMVPLKTTLAADVRNVVLHDLRALSDLAERQTLTENQMAQYDAILDDIDYGLFCELNAPLVYKRGRVLRHGKNSVTIQWNHGEDGIERVKGPLARAFDCLHENEAFSADVKFICSKLVQAERVTPLNEV